MTSFVYTLISGKSNDVEWLRLRTWAVLVLVLWYLFLNLYSYITVFAMSGYETNPFEDPTVDPFAVSYYKLSGDVGKR